MQQYDFQRAREVFAEIAQEHPAWTDAQVDLAIATFNRGAKGDYEQAAGMLDKVLQQQPDHVRAAYCQALLHRFFGDPALALPLFEKVVAADPQDAYATYYIGQCLMDMLRLEEAYAQFCRAQQLDPYLRSAYYEAFRAAQRLKRMDEAKQHLDQFQKLVTSPQARLAEIKYTRMGEKAEVLAIDVDRQFAAVQPTGPIFTDAQPLAVGGSDGHAWRELKADQTPPSMTVCDIDGDGQVDLFITAALQSSQGLINAVLLRRGDEFQLQADHALAQVSRVGAALWGDYDNDGLTDVYLCRQGPNQLWKQVEAGKWQDVTESTQTGGGDVNTVDGAVLDADHDGDLDLLLINDGGPNELLNNNLDGTFRPLAQEQGLARQAGESRGVVVADLDGDRDLDLVFLHKQPPHQVFLNDRLWAYRVASGFDEFCQTPIQAALAVDSDADGQVEIVAVSARGIDRWAPDQQGKWVARAVTGPSDQNAVSSPLAIQDVDGNGQWDVLHAAGRGWEATSLAGEPQRLFRCEPAEIENWNVALLDPALGPAVIGIRSAQPPVVWLPGPGRGRFATLSFTGREDRSEQMRSNASGIGVDVAVRVGGRFTAFDTCRHYSGPGQNLQPVAVGMGGAERIDFVRMTWPDGVLQTEMGLSAGELHGVQETQRQVSSCPVIFAWNGQRYQFVTDVLGVGGLGFNMGAGQYAEPRPWENVLLPPGVLVAQAGRYSIKIAEPMEEVCYLDSARLVAYDLPHPWRMSLDERFAASPPWPTGNPVFYRQCLTPIRATNDRGHDVTERIAAADLLAAPPGARDARFLGRTRQHTVSLVFDQPIEQLEGQPTLVLGGWIEYPYSQTMFAAWQAGADYEAVTVEAQAADGQWQVVLDRFGYIAGMPREASVPLPRKRLPEGTRQLRLRSNMEIYWDQIAVVGQMPCEQVVRHPLPLAAAFCHEAGFAARSTLEQRLPQYDYDRRLPLWDTRHQAGFYTQLGSVLPLIERTDDAVAIFGPGEEVHLEFAAPPEDAAPGSTRRFVLETNGWCKDHDLFTQDGDTVEPLPRRAEATRADSRQRDQLHRQYNTRYRSGW